ncbi:MAG: efflux RND transporter periplasmic adaptor subunit [Alphaproteobacteria bacterium]|nr:MAG: efflux RND transporter periplasmic adaptor subunit [Alphaproteobacteria bacterium]
MAATLSRRGTRRAGAAPLSAIARLAAATIRPCGEGGDGRCSPSRTVRRAHPTSIGVAASRIGSQPSSHFPLRTGHDKAQAAWLKLFDSGASLAAAPKIAGDAVRRRITGAVHPPVQPPWGCGGAVAPSSADPAVSRRGGRVRKRFSMRSIFALALSLVALAILAGAAFLYARGGAPSHEMRRGGGAIPVEVATVAPHAFADRIEAIGTAIADESVTLTARVAEAVRAVHFEDGQIVEKGAVLVEFEHDEETAALAEARAALVEAERQLERIRDLVARGNATQATLDERVRAVDEAKARVDAAAARVEDRILRAPFSGVLGLRQVSVGAVVTPGTAITTLDDVFPIKVDFAIPERFLSALATGQTILARAVAFPGETFRGTVKTVDSRVDPVTRAVTVRAEIANEDARLRPGMLLTVEVMSRERRSLAVPEEAIVPIGKAQYVFVVTGENVAERRQVTTGVRRPGVVEILDGLEAGESVVVAGAVRLRPGQPVRIIESGLPVARPQS